MNRNKAISVINQLPENFDLDILIEKLIFIDKVERGLSQAANRQIVTHKYVKQMVREWKS